MSRVERWSVCMVLCASSSHLFVCILHIQQVCAWEFCYVCGVVSYLLPTLDCCCSPLSNSTTARWWQPHTQQEWISKCKLIEFTHQTLTCVILSFHCFTFFFSSLRDAHSPSYTLFARQLYTGCQYPPLLVCQPAQKRVFMLATFTRTHPNILNKRN